MGLDTRLNFVLGTILFLLNISGVFAVRCYSAYTYSFYCYSCCGTYYTRSCCSSYSYYSSYYYYAGATTVSVGVIAGAVVGGLVGLAIAIAVVVIICRSATRRTTRGTIVAPAHAQNNQSVAVVSTVHQPYYPQGGMMMTQTAQYATPQNPAYPPPGPATYPPPPPPGGAMYPPTQPMPPPGYSQLPNTPDPWNAQPVPPPAYAGVAPYATSKV